METIAVRAIQSLWTGYRGRWQIIALLVVVIALAGRASAGDPLQLISAVDPSVQAAGGGGDSWASIISPDGRYVLFASTANNLVLGAGTNPLPALFPAPLNVFLRDRTNGTTTLVSANFTGTGGGNGDSWPSALSTNARYVLFESSATDLMPGDTNGLTDIFIRDLAAGTTTLVTISTNGGSADGASRSAVMTPDGRYVAFVSEADNLVPGDVNKIADVFVRDVQAGTTTLASVGAKSVGPPSGSGIWASSSEVPEISADGRFVAFFTTASNLVSGVQVVGDIYVRDLVGGTTIYASTYARTAMQAIFGKASAVCFNHALSDDGQFVAYEARPIPIAGSFGLVLRYSLQTGATDVVHTNAYVATGAYQDLCSLDMTPDGRFVAFVANTNGNTGATTCVEVWDAQTGGATLASSALDNTVPASTTCDWPTLDSSGRFVAFLSSATSLVTNTLAGDYHLYVRDLQAGTTALVDADTNGVGSPMSVATAPRLSAEGRFVAFECPDVGIVPNDRNRTYDVFVRDMATGTAELISTTDPALPSATANGLSALSTLSISSDGRYVAFVSDANNLVPNDTNNWSDIFVRDLQGTNVLVTVGTNGAGADSMSAEPAISANGRYMAFSSYADNLVPGDTNKAQDVFVCDLQTGTTSLVSINTTGTGPGNGNSYTPSISTDGRFVLFHSLARNIAAGTFTAGYENLFLRDRQLGTNYALTSTASATAGTPVGAMTPDGRFVAFYGTRSSSTGLYVWDCLAARIVYTSTISMMIRLGISPDGSRITYTTSSGLFALDWHAGTTRTVTSAPTGGLGPRFSTDGRWLAYAARLGTTNEVYLYDCQAGTNLLVSRGYAAGEPGNAGSDSPDISADGRFVAYRSMASNLVSGDTDGLPDIFLYDRQTSTTTLLSTSWLGPWAGNNRSFMPQFSGDGQTLVFQSWASDLVPHDFNQGRDVFAYSLYPSGSIPLFSATLLPGSIPGQGPRIMWPVVPGKTYSVQFKNSLSDPQWQALAGNITVTGSQAYLDDLSPGPGPKFYRVSAY